MNKNVSSSGSSSSGGIGFIGALTVLFIALKLTHVVDWDWMWVLSPIWIGTILFVLILAAVLFIWRAMK